MPNVSADIIGHEATAVAVDVLTFLDDPQILVLALNDLFNIAEILAQLIYFTVVELGRLRRRFLDVEAGADIDQHGGGGGEGARNI